MITQRFCGIDLNGWRDFSTRNWKIEIEEDNVDEGTINVNEGGLLPVVVKTLENWIGGIQAQQAPHGRGDGWGEIGISSNRVSVRNSLENTENIEQLVGAIEGLVSSSTHGILAIDDLPETSDEIREYYLDALASAKIRSKLLVWRPVLAALYAIEYEVENLNLTKDQKIGVICHSTNGFSLQKLRLRIESGPSSEILAPERKKTGIEIKSNLGYKNLIECSKDLLNNFCESESTGSLTNANAVGQLAFGLATKDEVIRLPNGTWEVVSPPSELVLPEFDLSTTDLSDINESEVILFETLTQGRVRSEICEKLCSLVGKKIHILPPYAVANGALIATQRMAKNESIYFDFLPIISTLVYEKLKATNHDLIEPDEVLPAGRTYTSPKPAKFQLRKDQKEIEIHLLKETHQKPRVSTLSLNKPLQEATTVELLVEQVPASGRAKILVNAPELSQQFIVDWDKATEKYDTWDEAKNDINIPKPTVPELLKLKCHINLWGIKYREYNKNLFKNIEDCYHSASPDWKMLSSALSNRTAIIDNRDSEDQGEKFYCISSDGDFPVELEKHTRDMFNSLTERALDHVRARVKGEIEANNNSLQFLTWQFKRCPLEITRFLFDASARRDDANRHPFLKRKASRVLVYQGLGRICREENELELISNLFKYDLFSWHWREEIACLAFLLSRSESAPKLLTEKQVQNLSKRIISDLKSSKGPTYSTLLYIPQLIVGLLRYRSKYPYSLMYGSDEIANEFVDSIEEVQTQMNDTIESGMIEPGRKTRLKNFVSVFDEIIKVIKGEGTIPGLPGRVHSLAGG